MKKSLAALVLLITSLGLQAHAAEPVRQDLGEIVVTATRSERSVEEVPAAVSVVGEETLKDLPLLGPKEALSGLAGVQSETKNGGYDTRLIIRGAGLKARYGVREIMILLDGVPITDPDGMSRLDFVDTQLIERIDVVRGPNSTLYGANAAGGVVNIITRNPYAERKSLTLGYGSDNSQLYSGILGTSFGQTYLTLTGTRKQTDGWREWNEFESSQASLKLGKILDNGGSLETNLSYTKADLQLPGTLTEQQFHEDPSQLTNEAFRHNGRYSKILNFNLKYEQEIGNWKFTPLIYLQDWEHYHPVPGRINDGGATVFGLDLQSNYRHKLGNTAGELIVGLSGQYDNGDGEKYTYRDLVKADPNVYTSRILASLSDRKGDLAETSSDNISKWGVYLQESLRPNDSWIIDAGVRYDRVRFDLYTNTLIDFSYGTFGYTSPNDPPVVTKVDKSYDQVSPRLGILYKLSPQVNLYSNISTGFQTPQGSEIGENHDLSPSLTYNYEIGLRSRSKVGHRFDLALYYQQVKDEIVQTLIDKNTIYSNAGRTEKRGIEASGELRLPFDLSLGGTYTYSDFTFDTFDEPVGAYNPASHSYETTLVDRSGNQLPYVPKHQYSLYLGYKNPKGFKARLNTSSWGSYWVDNANSEKYKGYELVTNLMLGWENEHWDFVLDISNLFDKEYAMEVTKSSDTLAFRPGAPRSLFAKLTYRF